ncbi:MAG: rRNA maturation RNase YbeY [Clostridiaceae bacterium]|nr:rRNA maturation RNase YbeY [Clostridiaceae bacterium]
MNKPELSLELFFPEFCFKKPLATSEHILDLNRYLDSEQSSNLEKYLDLEQSSDTDLPQMSESEKKLFSELKLEQTDLLNDLLFELSKIILNREKSVQQLLLQQELSARIDVELVPGQTMRQINTSTRGIDEITDVLSFPTFSFELIHKSRKAKKCEIEDFDFIIEPYAWLDPTAEYGTISLGEILICPLKAQEQAEELGHSLIREVCFLFMHGLLHLCGYDHQTEQEAAGMFALQRNIMPELENLINKYFDFEE